MSGLAHARLVLRLAARDLRGGLKGMRVFLACIAIGVAAIVAVGAVSDSLVASFAQQGRALIGGDLALARSQRPLTGDERAGLRSFGALSQVATLRAMARAGRTGTADDVALVEIKAVDAAYPLVGALASSSGRPLSEDLSARDGGHGVLIDPALADRLNVKTGDGLVIGAGRYRIAGEIVSEPDRVAFGVGFGPRVMMSRAGLAASGLDGPTALVRWSTRIARPGMSDDGVARAAREIAARFPDAGWEIRDRANASPQIQRNIARFTQFMGLIGVVSLIVGGVGVAGAVRAFVERKRESIAILKALGASGALAFAIVLAEMMAIAAGAALAGALVGAATPFVVAAFVDSAQFPLAPVVSLRAAAVGCALGLVTAFAFVVAPAGRAHDTPVSTLFRIAGPDARAGLRPRYLVAAALAFLALAAGVYAISVDRTIAAIVMAGVAGAALILRAAAALIAFGARRAPRFRALALNLALANLHRPGAPTASVVASLGLGLTLLVAIVAVENNVQRQLSAGSARTPDFFFVDVQADQADAFRAFLRRKRPNGTIEEAPMLRGRIVRVGGRAASEAKPDSNAAWALEGDRGVTFSATPPEGSRVVAGRWWAKDYAGPPLVSLDAEIASGLGLNLGDTLAVNVAGRVVEARVASLRQVDWRSFGINFVLVFSPSTFAGAPHGVLFTLASQAAGPRGGASDSGGSGPALSQRALLRAVAADFPNVTAIGVREALDAVMAVVAKIGLAVRIAALVTLTTAALVLGGAIAAGQRARHYDAAVLRTLGARRSFLLLAHFLEFAVLGLATSAFAVAAGAMAAAVIVEGIMRFEFAFDPPLAAAAALAGALTAIALGLGAGARALGRKPARVLREL